MDQPFGHQPWWGWAIACIPSRMTPLSESTTLSSLSPDWVNAVRESGRFSNQRWVGTQTVPVTTLEKLIEDHGVPAFTKIDVEGFEFEVLSGLKQPLRIFSLEFTPEWFDKSASCIAYVGKLGNVVWNFSEGESMKLTHDHWVTSDRWRRRGTIRCFLETFTASLSRVDLEEVDWARGRPEARRMWAANHVFHEFP